MCKKANRKYLGISLSRKSLQKHRKKLLLVQQKEKKGKKREKSRKYIKKTNLLLSNVNSSGQTINRELHGTQFIEGLQ